MLATHYNAVNKYRRVYREEEIALGYSAVLHFTLINLITLTTLLVTGYYAATCYWPLLLATLVACNFGEWYKHRYTMHEREVYSRHANQHHRFFTNRFMAYDNFQDGHAIFFPIAGSVRMVVGALFAALPFWFCWERSAAATVAAGVIFYYWFYEWLHLLYHTPGVERVPFLSYLQRHHQIHHRQSLMHEYNFNVTLPLADWLFSTYY